ncbi:MAG: AAA family ATPase [Saprospiraceae bacterium]|nr:AAA family ATPase [Saprospiraceae bacterium]
MFLRQIRLKNLFSFGPETPALDMQPLNVLIGPNGSGKSNLLEAIALMRATPGDMRAVVRRGGGVGEWIWKGLPGQPAEIDWLVSYPQGKQPLRHKIAFRGINQVFALDDERIENATPYPNQKEPYFYYRYQHGQPVLNTVEKKERRLAQDTVDADQSILTQRRDPDLYPELAYLAGAYEKIRIYREWAFGRNTVFREPQKADMRNDRLEEDFSNLGLFLNRLRRTPKAKAAILEGLTNLYQEISDFDVIVEGGTVQVFFTEGDFTIPATRLSDGTLRYLCLLAILCDPTPPPLICIEEPELGLHPDVLIGLADLLVEASSRTQLIVTTHSDIIIDAMTEHPESVVVCEKHEGKTYMARLQKDDLKDWLDEYRLGELWIKGQIGGKRW